MESRKNEDMNPGMFKSEEEEEREEVEMEMFFALLRSFREARDRRKTELGQLQRDDVKVDDGNESSIRKKKKNTIQDVAQTSWIPSFEWEDFTKEVEFKGTPPAFPAPVLDQKEKPKVDDGLDLNLAL